MGVTGLWSLLEPAGKPVPLEALENKVLAVDVSIWLNQSLHGFRDATGASLPNAHLIGLLHRVCKLLFYRIKPVFVFDGAPPQLKKDTLFKRRQRKGGAQRRADQQRAKIIDNYLRSQLVAKKLERQTQQVEKVLSKGQDGLANLLNKRSKTLEKDLFQLPERRPEDEDDDVFSDDDDRDLVLAELNIAPTTDIHAVDVDSSKFQALSHQKQYEVLLELRERRKQNSWAKVHEMPKKANDFSGFQLERCLKRRNIQKKMDDVGSALNEDDLESAVADHKLFVGDRKGIKRQREERKINRIKGKDFVYIEGIKKMLEEKEGEGAVSQEEVLAIIEAQERSLAEGPSTSRRQLGDEDEDSGDDIIEVTEVSMKSSRQGGVSLDKLLHRLDPNASGPSGPSHAAITIKEEPLDPEEEEEGGGGVCSEVPEPPKKKTKKEEAGVEISLDLREEAPEDDLFADIFEGKTEAEEGDGEEKPLSLRDLLEKGEKKEKAEQEEENDAVDEIMSETSSSEDEFEEVAKADEQEATEHSESSSIIGQARYCDSTEEAFAHIMSKARKDKPEEEEEEASSSTQHLAETMKKSDHLLLKITSKYMAEETVQAPKKNVEPEKSKVKGGPSVLDEETRALVEEMRTKQREARLMEIKGRTADAEVKEDDRSKFAAASSTTASEAAVLDSLSAKAVDADAYNKEVLGLPDAEKRPDDGGTVYGASAPGFVRSKKLGPVVETEGDDGGVRLNESIAMKLEAPEDAEGEEDNLLTVSELREIQESLAKDQNQLVAEKGRQERMAATLSDQMYAECQELLQLFGLPWIVAPSEAEAQCAFLDMNNLSEGTITDDSDAWLFGGQTVYKNFFNTDKHCERFCVEEISKHLGLSREKMVLLALLTGSDYTMGIDDVGPVTAMEIMSEFTGPGLEPLKRFRSWWEKHSKDLTLPPESKVREGFRRLDLPASFPSSVVHDAYLNPRVDNSGERFSWAVPNFVEIQDFAVDRLGWTRSKIDEVMKPVIKTFSARISQGRIDSYFRPDRISLPEKGNFQRSKRVQAAIDKARGRIADTKAGRAKEPRPGPSKSSVSSSVKTDPAPPLSVRLTAKELEEQKREEAKAKAIQLFKKANQRRAKKGKPSAKRPLVLPEHNLSESDSD